MRQLFTRRLEMIAALICLGVGAPLANAQAPDAAFKAALSEGEAADKTAAGLQNQWPATDAALVAARKAAAAGDFDTATRLARDAKALAEASIAQARREKDLWRDSELR